jgi:hypothetical protein
MKMTFSGVCPVLDGPALSLSIEDEGDDLAASEAARGGGKTSPGTAFSRQAEVDST